MKRFVRFLRVTVVVVATMLVAMFLALVIADKVVAHYPALFDSRSNGWGAILVLSALILIRIFAWIITQDKVYSKIAGK